MAVRPSGPKYAAATMNPRNQNVESVHRLVSQILNMAGCAACGRLALLRLEFLSDPPPDLTKENVISFERQGF